MTGMEQVVVEASGNWSRPSGTAWTGPHGRAALLDLIRRTLAGIRSGKMVGVVAVDVDDFETLVVACGDATGHIILSEVTQRLVDRLSSARYGVCREGSRYLLMSELAATPDSIQSFLEQTQACFDEPVVVASTSTYISACTGVTFSTNKSDDARLLLGAAEVACARARRAGSRSPIVFDGGARSRIDEEFEQSQALREAIAKNELVLHYRPIIDLQRGEPVGLSTDLVWQPLNGDRLTDRDLLRRAERLGLDVELGEVLLEEFIDQWSAARHDHMGTSPSVTIRATSEQLGSWLLRSSDQLSRARATVPGTLSIEIVESGDRRGAYEEEGLDWLHRLGINVVLDEIGDRSLLTSLRAASVDVVRLSRDLVERVHEEARERDLVADLIALAHKFGIAAIADGVRDQAQIDVLTELGCDQVRGYFVSGSLPLGDATAFLKGFVHDLRP